jgi:hypothetical protein
MILVRILKRKDASSIVVAVVIGLIIVNLLPHLTGELANNISGAPDGQTFTGNFPGAAWEATYLQPVVWAALQLIALEVLSWIYLIVAKIVSKVPKLKK